MTYRAPTKPYIAELRYSGSPTQVNYTYSLAILQQTESLLSVSSGTDLSLPAGHYYCVAYPDFTRSGTTDNNQIHWFLDGTQIGKLGGSDFYGGESCDSAEAAFTLHVSGVLTLRQTAQNNNAITLTNDALAYVWRVPR